MNSNPMNVISPHQDDAAASLSISLAALSARGISIRIINCFTVTQFAPFHSASDSTDISALRRQEDRTFARELGITDAFVDLGRRDAPLRSLAGIRGIICQDKLDAEDQAEIISLAKDIRRIACAGPLLLPLALGNHIDHHIALRAGLLARDTTSVALYEDLPYAARRKSSEIESVVASLGKQLELSFSPTVIHFDNALQFKEKCLRIYKSQLTSSTIRRLLNYAKLFDNGERIWLTPDLRRTVGD
jgi:LmbE family N-acetylglucosaminyl deacetylase